jgi:hypothetical protein
MRTIAQLARDLSPKDAKVRKRIHRQVVAGFREEWLVLQRS